MKLVHIGMIATGAVIVLGVGMIAPAFTQHQADSHGILLMLSFNIVHPEDAASWCNELSSMLEQHQLKATVFVTGKIAETNPECVRSFSTDVDVGSQTYSYANLVSLGDYPTALEEIQKGKQAVDSAGNLNSLLFRAPDRSTNEDIYSLLTRSDIIADFSYVNHYNKYEGGQFVRYDLKSLPGNSEGMKFFSLVSGDDDVVSSEVPVEIAFDNSMKVGEIDRLVSEIASYQDIHFVNASDLAGVDLTKETAST